MIRPVAVLVLASLCSSLARAQSSPQPRPEPRPQSEPATPSEPEPLVPAPLPQIASVFPGLLIHGSGTFLQGRNPTTYRLLLMEGSGIGLTLLGGIALFTTGASRRVVGPAALTAMGGVNLFALSLLSSLYASAAPREGLGVPRRELGLLESSLGYLYVYDPQFAFHHFATIDVDARVGPWHIAADSAVAPLQGNSRWKLSGGYRFLGPQGPREPVASDGSYLELQLGFGDHYYGDDEFTSRVLELGLEARIDSQRYLPDVRGAFFQLGAGFAKQWLVFDLPAGTEVTDTSLLLAHFGFGMYLGDAATQGGELELYYDHRHDGFAAGLKVNGLGSGVAGHFGLRGSYTINPDWAVSAMTEVGSAWVLGTSVTWRTDGP